MEAHPDAGIIQTVPARGRRDTLHARIQQFANRVYGPLFTAGLNYWQLGESHYWGHNAIMRLEPFMKHCVLAPLPGRGALAGEMLSHDFVEAARMRRAGYGVWMAYDLPGSYEELPSNLIEEVGARPPLVPRQPDERAADVRARNAPGAPHRVPDRRARLRVGAAVGRLPRAVDAGCW